MGTGDTFVSIQTKRILGFQDFRERFLEYVLGRLEQMQDLAFGDDGVFGGVPVTMSVYLATTRFELDNDQVGTDNDGHFLTTDAELAGRDIGIEFENTPALVYDVGLHYAERPRGVQVNPRTGLPEFVALEETVGERAEPTVVVDDGDGTMTFTIDSVTNPFDATAMTAAGRQCLVWKKIPGRAAITEPVAVEQLIVTWDGSNNKIATAGGFGQTTISTTLSDYYVLLLGPTVIRNNIKDLELEPAYEFIGQVTGHATVPTFDITSQNDLGAGYAIALNAITRTDSHGDLKVRVSADATDVNERQISIENDSGVTKWFADEVGNQDLKGVLSSIGEDRLSSKTEASVARASGLYGDTDSPTYTLLSEFTRVGGSRQGFRAYAMSDSALTARMGYAVSVNAFFNTSTSLWNTDKATKPALLARFNTESTGANKTSQIIIEKHDPAATFIDSAWEEIIRMDLPEDVAGGTPDVMTWTLRNALLKIDDSTTSGTNPASSVALPNTLCAKNLCSAWGLFELDGGGGVALLDGFNLDATPAIIVAPTHVRVFAAQGFASANWGARASYWAKDAVPLIGECTCETLAALPNECLVRLYNSAGALRDPSAVAMSFYWEAKGQQDT